MNNVQSTTPHRFVTPPPVGPVPVGDRPSFSIITAAYNAAATIGEAMESACAQTLTPLEIIVVDDGSTDETVAALEPWLDRITLVRTPNRGVAAARNEAARRATGDFLCNLDADDVFLPDRLSALADLAIARPDLDLLVSNVVYEQRDRRPIVFYRRGKPFPTEDQRAAIIAGCFPQHPAIRRSIFEKHGGFDEQLVVAEDWDLWLRAILSGSRAGLVDAPLLRYRQQPTGLTSNVRRLVAANEMIQTRTLERNDLSPSEQEIARAGLAKCARLHALLDGHEALARGDADRRTTLAVARDSGYPVSTRLKALVATIFPKASGRRLARKTEQQSGSMTRNAE